MKSRSPHAMAIVALTAGVLSWPALRQSVGAEADRPVTATNPTAAVPLKTKKTAARPPRYKEHQIAAGTTVPLELRTRLSSNGSRRADAIEGRLLRPLMSIEGVELVPAGSSVLGTVSDAQPAGLRQPGRLAFSFQIIEHPETGSRATIKTEVLRFESPLPVKGNLFADIRLDKGADASSLLLAPLLVRIPVVD